MTSTRLVIDYDNRKIPEYQNDHYCIQATVDALSVPSTMHKCLVVRRGSIAIPERLNNIASWDAIYGDPPAYPLPTLPTYVNMFTSVGVGSIPVSSVITVHSPIWWMQYFSVPAIIDVTVQTIAGVITPSLPAFGNNLQFEVNGGPSFYDGLADRLYPTSELYYRTHFHCSEWNSYDDANNTYNILLSGAQTLVDAYNDDNFTLQTQKIYT